MASLVVGGMMGVEAAVVVDQMALLVDTVAVEEEAVQVPGDGCTCKSCMRHTHNGQVHTLCGHHCRKRVWRKLESRFA